MSALPQPVVRYLTSRASKGPWCITGTERHDFSMAVVIPVLAENATLPATLKTLTANPPEYLAKTLILLVINQRPDSTVKDKNDNQHTLRELADGLWKHPGLHLAWIDAASPGLELPAKDGGVGLARKIGFDLALQRLSFEKPDPLLIALDADTLVRPDYLPALQSHFRDAIAGAAVVPFCHQAGNDPIHEAAIARYELFLRSHLLGLTLAGSPYAFHTVGSTMACRATAYARAGGMNRRQAGEDFYFLQQLAKTTGVATLCGTVVYPSARSSARTPFGTGRSVNALLAGDSTAVLFYPAACYTLLGDWLQLVNEQLEADGETLQRLAEQYGPPLAEFLQNENFPDIWDRLALNHLRPKARLKAFHDWFDGLKTTRLIHHLCAASYPRCQPEEVVPQLLKAAGLPIGSCLIEQLTILRLHQGALA
ncbi:MAG: hypothetical protein K8R55_01885 [Desulfuromonadaceae bacterium]|nr:hypothetical protein [Desulfuromonadaceae bacterium]